jgi:hypothetical protein
MRDREAAEGEDLGVSEAVLEEVDGAALGGALEDLRDRGLRAGVGVADGELDADQAALDQSAQQAGPERFGLGLADIDAEHLAAAGLVSGALLPSRGPAQAVFDHD